MKRVTLYWDKYKPEIYYNNGKEWRTYTAMGLWRACFVQDWSAENFEKSLTVNNFKEK